MRVVSSVAFATGMLLTKSGVLSRTGSSAPSSTTSIAPLFRPTLSRMSLRRAPFQRAQPMAPKPHSTPATLQEQTTEALQASAFGTFRWADSLRYWPGRRARPSASLEMASANTPARTTKATAPGRPRGRRRATTGKPAAGKHTSPSLGDQVLALATGKTQQEIAAACRASAYGGEL